MLYRMNNDAYILGLPFVVVFVLWIVLALVAAWVAPADRRVTFFLLTAFFLGPIGLAAASIAQPRTAPQNMHNPAPGRTRYICPRCRATTDVPDGENFECWRCHQR